MHSSGDIPLITLKISSRLTVWKSDIVRQYVPTGWKPVSFQNAKITQVKMSPYPWISIKPESKPAGKSSISSTVNSPDGSLSFFSNATRRITYWCQVGTCTINFASLTSRGLPTYYHKLCSIPSSPNFCSAQFPYYSNKSGVKSISHEKFDRTFDRMRGT